MTVTLSSLLTQRTKAQIKAELIATLQSEGIQTSDWTSTAIERAFVELEANALSDLVAGTVPAIAAGGYLSTAEDDWLTLLAADFYNIPRALAESTTGTITLTCSATAGPYTITAGNLLFQASAAGVLYQYSNTTGGVLASGGTLDVTIAAEASGSGYNVAANAITTMLTPLPGVTCTNAASTFSAVTHTGGGSGTALPTAGTADRSWVLTIATSGTLTTATFNASVDGGLTDYVVGATVVASYGPDAESLEVTFANPDAVATPFIAGDTYTFQSPGTWIITQGSDDETDAPLSAACSDRWPALGNFATRNAYELMVREVGGSGVRSRIVTNPSTAATVDIYIAGPSGAASAAAVAEVQDYLDPRAGLTDLVVVAPTVNRVVTLAGATVRVKAENYTAAVNAADANVQAYINQIPISDGAVYVRISQVVEAILRESGSEDDSVNGLTINTFAADLLLAANEVATWAQTIETALTWVTY